MTPHYTAQLDRSSSAELSSLDRSRRRSTMPSDDPLPVNVPAKIIPRKNVTAPAVSAPSRATQAFRRDRITWACYLALALFAYFLNIQGNIIPFLRDELALSYWEVSLHPAALAGGL